MNWRGKNPIGSRRVVPGIFAVLLLFSLCVCRQKKHDDNASVVLHDLPQIKDSGELVAITLYSSTSYFIYRGEQMGFQYELCEQFARSQGLRLRMEVARNTKEMVNKLLLGEVDLIAYNLPVTKEMKDSLLYCGEDFITHQVIVQSGNGKQPPLTDVTMLVGKDVYVKPGKFYNRIQNLDEELGGGIHIHKMEGDSVTVEDLIAWVAEGKIGYTVADDEVAQLNKTYYPSLDISLAVSFDQRASWAVRKDEPLLAEAIDEWYKLNSTSPAYRASEKRYFEISKQLHYSPILSLKDGKISHYDRLFKKYAKEVGWDWRLLASLAYTESNFDTAAVSWAGAKGLMQLMPATARAMGLPAGKERNSEESIKAAVRYIGQMNKSLGAVTNEEERIRFILAAYNAGLGHVYDAIALAGKYGKNKDIWYHNVENFLLLKSHEEYFTDPVCKYGYFRGRETYSFVREVLSRYDFYKKKITN